MAANCSKNRFSVRSRCESIQSVKFRKLPSIGFLEKYTYNTKYDNDVEKWNDYALHCCVLVNISSSTWVHSFTRGVGVGWGGDTLIFRHT